MPEIVSPGEVAHTLGHQHTEQRMSRRAELVEKAPPGPLLMPQYRNAAAAQAKAYDTKASAAFEEGTHARELGDKYLRNTVLLATVLFLTALAQKFRLEGIRIGLLAVSGVLLVVALYFVGTYPRA